MKIDELKGIIKSIIKEAIDDSIPAFGSPYDDIPDSEWRKGFISTDRIKKVNVYNPHDGEMYHFYELDGESYDTYEDALEALDIKNMIRDSEEYREREAKKEEDVMEEEKGDYDEENLDSIHTPVDSYLSDEEEDFEVSDKVKELLDVLDITENDYSNKAELIDLLGAKFSFYRRIEPDMSKMNLCKHLRNMLL